MKTGLWSILPLLAVASLVSCGEEDSTTQEALVTTAPETVASWGTSDYRAFLKTPSDLYASPLGSLYVVQQQPSERLLLVLDRETAQQTEFNTPYYPIAVDGNTTGTRIAVLFGSQRKVGVFGSDRQLLAEWDVPLVPGDEPWSLIDIAVDSRNNHILVIDRSGWRVLRFTLDGVLVRETRPAELREAGFSSQSRIVVLPSGDWLLKPNLNGFPGIYRYAQDGEPLGPWGGGGHPLANIMVRGLDDRIYVSTLDGAVCRFDPSGDLLGLTAVEPSRPIILGVGALAADADGTLLVADNSFPVIHEYGATGQRQGSRFLAEPLFDEIKQPNDLALGPDGTVAALDILLRRVSIATPGRGVEAHWGSPETSTAPLIWPVAFARAADASWYVYDSQLNQMLNYGSDGTLRHVREQFPGGRMGTGRFWIYCGSSHAIYRRSIAAPPEVPWESMVLRDVPDDFAIGDLCVGRDNRLYMWAYRSTHIDVLDADGRYLDRIEFEWPRADFSTTDFAVDADGWFYFINSAGDYVVYDNLGRLHAHWEEHFGGWASAIEVDEDGFIYVARPYLDFRKLAPVH